jgi:hypothetical protein
VELLKFFWPDRLISPDSQLPRLVLDQVIFSGGQGMTHTVAKVVERQRQAGYDINPVSNSHLWQVSGRGHMSTGQLIDLSVKVARTQ